MTTRCPADSKALNRSFAKPSALSSPERDTVMSTRSFLYGFKCSASSILRLARKCSFAPRIRPWVPVTGRASLGTRGAGCRAGLQHRCSRKLVGPGPHDGITRHRFRKRRPLRRLAHRQLGPVAALRTRHPQLGTHPGEVASRHLELLGDLGHWRRPNQLVEIFPRDHVRPRRHRHPPTRVMTRARSTLWWPWLTMNRRA